MKKESLEQALPCNVDAERFVLCFALRPTTAAQLGSSLVGKYIPVCLPFVHLSWPTLYHLSQPDLKQKASWRLLPRSLTNAAVK